MKQRNYIILAAVILVLIVGLLVFYNLKNDKARAAGVFVSTSKVEMGRSSQSAALSGKLEAVYEANMVSKIAGRVRDVNVDIGSQVKSGDILLTLDAQDLEASVAQAQAAVGVAQYNLQAAQIDYETARGNYERNKSLYEQGAISQSVFENQYLQPFKKAEQYATSGAEAQLRQALAALDLARANYANSIISSPIEGVVTARNIDPGELATTSNTLFSVVNLDKVILKADVDENSINDLKEGWPVLVKVSAVSSQPFPGIITNIAQGANSTSKGFTVKIRINNPEHQLKPGMFAEAVLNTAGHFQLVIPNAAIVTEGDQSFVWVVDKGIASKKAIVKEAGGETQTVVHEGLTEGQEIVTSGFEHLQDGMKVNVQTQ